MSDLKANVLMWLAYGRVGVSSKCMALCAAGMEQDDMWGISTPSDPDDLNRCLLLLAEIPEIRSKFSEIAKLSKKWRALIERWDEIETCFLNEVGFNWSNGNRAPKTYKLMKDILQ